MADIVVSRPGYNKERGAYTVIFHAETYNGRMELAKEFVLIGGMALIHTDKRRELDEIIEQYVQLWFSRELSVEVY